jgi:protein-S-isoprenylcysteine O-methyltransferase Ste14
MKILTNVELYAVAGSWALFILAFVTRRKGARTSLISRNRSSLGGLLLQLAALGIVRADLRAPGTGFLTSHLGVEYAVAAVAFALMAASIMLAFWAVRTLGKQWSLAARLVEGHKLITAGPYAMVRHPIYTAMLGMLVGSAIAISQWPALLGAVALFLLGTTLRVRAEERLLTAEFGDSYRDYARLVPALVPRLVLGRPASA